MMGLFPFIERWITGDKSDHHSSTGRATPRPAPLSASRRQTGYAMLWIGGGNDMVATTFDVSLNSVTYFLRVVSSCSGAGIPDDERICIGLQRSDEERLLHGGATGIIVRDPSGQYPERHRTDRRWTRRTR